MDILYRAESTWSRNDDWKKDNLCMPFSPLNAVAMGQGERWKRDGIPKAATQIVHAALGKKVLVRWWKKSMIAYLYMEKRLNHRVQGYCTHVKNRSWELHLFGDLNTTGGTENTLDVWGRSQLSILPERIYGKWVKTYLRRWRTDQQSEYQPWRDEHQYQRSCHGSRAPCRSWPDDWRCSHQADP